jgi:HK97 family phage portal protein
MKLWDKIVEKLNPAQTDIVDDYGDSHSPSANLYNNQIAYNTIEIVNRGVNLLVDGAADIKLDLGEPQEFFNSEKRVRAKRLTELLNFKPNPYYNADLFKRNIFIDLILEGDAFIYFDGAYLYHLPALNVDIIADKKTYIKEYHYADKVFKPSEIIHIKDNSGDSIYEGRSRLDSAKQSLVTLKSMLDYQKNFFDNSAVPGIILITPNPLSERVKTRMTRQWMSRYNPSKGGKRPMILDGEFKVESLSKYNFNELDFVDSIANYEKMVLKALGVPPILLDSGNNANINPNLRMFYVETILPLVNKVVTAIEWYFGYDIKPVTQDVLALRPELKDQSDYLTSITNAGIITRNEARAEIRMPRIETEEADELIIPANIAGSAVDPSEGGRPSNDEETNE